MTNLKNTLIAFWRDEKGLTTVEYAIAGGLVGAVAIGAFTNLGTQVGRVIGLIVTALTGVNRSSRGTPQRRWQRFRRSLRLNVIWNT